MSPSLVHIVADSVRYDALSCCRQASGGRAEGPFGLSALPSTPTLDALAREGTLFERVITAAPWTLPSLGSMLTGVYAHRLGLARWDQPWPADRPTLFELAEQAGYEVASFVFDPDHLFSRVPAARVRGSSQDTEAVLDWLRAHRDRPTLVFIHYWWTHIPYVDRAMSVPEWRLLTGQVLAAVRAGGAARAGVQRLYAHSVERLSEVWLPKVLSELDLARTWVSFTADHGESWGERTPGAPPSGVFDLHGNALREEVLHIPWIVRPPGGGPARRVRELTRTVDFTPTLAKLLGWGSAPSDLDGRDLATAVLTGRGEPGLDALSVRNHDWLTRAERPRSPADLYCEWALTAERWRHTWEPTSDRRQSFDLEADPGETHDRAAELRGPRPLAVASEGPHSLELARARERLHAELGRARVDDVRAEDADRLTERMRQWGYLE